LARLTETLFYHLERRTLEDVLPGLVEKSLARGWRALVRTDSAERSDMLDTLLWTYDDRSFLPHAQAGDGDPTQQPVLISVEDANLNRAEIVFYVGGVVPDDWREMRDLVRVVLLFDGRDGEALARARAAWKEARAAGYDVTYWKEGPSGKFEKQG
jgi:DNA polymerase-3 subunit chi